MHTYAHAESAPACHVLIACECVQSDGQTCLARTKKNMDQVRREILETAFHKAEIRDHCAALDIAKLSELDDTQLQRLIRACTVVQKRYRGRRQRSADNMLCKVRGKISSQSCTNIPDRITFSAGSRENLSGRWAYVLGHLLRRRTCAQGSCARIHHPPRWKHGFVSLLLLLVLPVTSTPIFLPILCVCVCRCGGRRSALHSNARSHGLRRDHPGRNGL